MGFKVVCLLPYRSRTSDSWEPSEYQTGGLGGGPPEIFPFLEPKILLKKQKKANKQLGVQKDCQISWDITVPYDNAMKSSDS